MIESDDSPPSLAAVASPTPPSKRDLRSRLAPVVAATGATTGLGRVARADRGEIRVRSREYGGENRHDNQPCSRGESDGRGRSCAIETRPAQDSRGTLSQLYGAPQP